MKANEKIEYVDITPHTSLMPKLGHSGYTVGQAIAELIDNCIDDRDEARTTKIDITLDKNGKFLEITDDGLGMDKEKLRKAMTLAHSEKMHKLGLYGLGLKTAGQSLGRRIIVETTPRGSASMFTTCYDEDEWKKNGTWSKFPIKVIEEAAKKEDSWTKIRIENLKFKYYYQRIPELLEDFSLRYSPFIKNNEVVLTINGTKAKPGEHEFVADTYEPISLAIGPDKAITGWVALQLRGSAKFSGFHIFWNKRLVKAYEKIGYNYHPEARQIIGEINLDFVPVTHNKREFLTESPEYVEAEEAMRTFMEHVTKKARDFARDSELDKVLDEKVKDELTLMAKAVNTIPELKDYSLPKSDPEKAAGTANSAEVSDVEKRKVSLKDEPVMTIEEEDIQVEPTTKKKGRKPHKTHKRRRFTIRINGKRYKFEHVWSDLKETAEMWEKDVNKEKGVITVFSYKAFPALRYCADKLFYATFCVAEAISEAMVESRDESKDKAKMLRNKILAKTAQIKQEIEMGESLARRKERLLKEIQDIEKKEGTLAQDLEEIAP